MKLNPQEAPLYGECVLTVKLDEECSAEQQEEEEVEFYLIFSGSTQRHVSSTLRVSQVTLQAMCPGHNVCEQVLVTLCLARPGGTVDPLSQQTFSFVQDLALDMASFLLDSTAAQEALLLNNEQIPLEECQRLDENLALALRHLSQLHHRTAPGDPHDTHTGVETETVTETDTHRPDTGMDGSSPQSSCPAVSECQQLSSLLHLAASHGLKAVASFLLQQLGGKEVLRRTNTRGSTPAYLAKTLGEQQLLELFTPCGTFSDVQSEAEKTLQVYPKGGVFQHYASVGTYTLTILLRQEGGAETDGTSSYSLQDDIKELRRLIQLHRDTQVSGIPLLKDRPQGDNWAAVSQVSCTVAHREDEGRGHKDTPAASSAGRNKKNKKRTTKTKRPAVQRLPAAIGSGTVSPRVAAVTGARRTQETPSPIRPVLGPGAEGKCAGRKAVALPTTSITEKQEGEKWEVELLMRKLVAETGRDTQRLRVEKPAKRTGTMGQEQSQDPQDHLSEQEKPSSPDTSIKTSPKPTDSERKGRRALWGDGGSTGTTTGSEAGRKPVWHKRENSGQVANEDSSRKEVNSQSVWYDSATMVETNHEQMEPGVSEERKCDMSSPRASGLSSPQLLEQGLCAAHSESHAAGKQSALSHGPNAQRQEAHGPQQEEEVRSDCKKAGVEGDREEVSNRETSYSGQISEAEDTEVGREKLESEEKLAKGRKRRRKKKGKRGEAKLSSSSSVESQSQLEIQKQSEQETNPSVQSETADGLCLTVSEPAGTEEAEDKAMHLPSHTEVRTQDARGRDSDVANSDCVFTASELSQTDIMRTDTTEVTASSVKENKESSEDVTVDFDDCNSSNLMIIDSKVNEKDSGKVDAEIVSTVQPMAAEILEPSELETKQLVQQTLNNVEAKALSQNEDLTVTCTALGSMNQIDVVNSKSPKDLIKHSHTTGLTQDSFLAEFPEESTPKCVDSDKAVHSAYPTGRPGGFVECVRPTEAAFVPSEDAADVSPLHIWEGSTETTSREYLEHCFTSEMLRGQQHREEDRHEMWVGVEKETKERSQSEQNDSGLVHAKKLSSMDQDQQVAEDEDDCPSLLKYNEDLVAAAVAVVTVAIASAMASIELSQHLGGSVSESQEAADGPSFAQGTKAASPALTQLQLSPQLIHKAVTPADTGKQPAVHACISLTNQTGSPEQAKGEPSEECDSAVMQSLTQAESFPAQKQSWQHQTGWDLSSPAGALILPQYPKEEIQKEALQKQSFTSLLPKEEDSQLKFPFKPLAEAGEVIPVEKDHMQKESQFHCQDSVPQMNPPLREHREPQNHIICPNEGDGHFQMTETLGICSSSSVEPTGAESHSQQHRSEDSESCENSSHDRSASDSKAEGSESHLQLVGTPHQSEAATFSLSCGSALPVSPADSSAEEAAAPGKVETGEILSSQSSANTNHPAAVPLEAQSDTNQREAHENVFVEANDAVFEGPEKKSDTLHTVDGWEDREMKEGGKGEMEAGKDGLTVEDISQTEAAKEEEEAWDTTPTVQIHRESDIFYPVQSCLDHSTLTPCTDLHPDRADCVPVCLVQSDAMVKDSLKVSTELDDDGTQKPEAPPPGASQSSTNNASMQGAVSPPQEALSVGTSDAVAPQSSTLSWMSEIEDRGGGTEGAEEEEKKDQLLENPASSATSRASSRSLSPYRRHSWEPGQSTAAQTDLSQSSSLKSLPAEMKRAKPPLHRRSYSLDSLEVGGSVVQMQCPRVSDQEAVAAGRSSHLDSQDRGSLASLTEEEQEGDSCSIDSQTSLTASCSSMFPHQTLPKSMSVVTITQQCVEVSGFPRSKRRISFSLSISPLLPKPRLFFSIGSSSSDEEEEGGSVSSISIPSGSQTYSIVEDEPGPLQSEAEGKGGPKISRTFSYLRSKMSKKSKDKDKERRGESKLESKEREKMNAGGHPFIPTSPPGSTVCQHSSRLLCNKETFSCNNCGVHVPKTCTETLSVCTKSRTKQSSVPEGAPGSTVNMRTKSTSSTSSLSSASSSSSRWSAVTTPDDQFPVLFPRRHPSIFNPHSNLSKSISSTNIAGLDDVPLKGLKFLSQSTDSLSQGIKGNASTESLSDEGTEMSDSQLVEFEHDTKDLEADSWSGMVDKKFLKTLKKDEIKRQDVIYELYQTEVHHVRTLKIMAEVYYKRLQKELQLDTQTLDKVFPVLDELVEIHTEFLSLLLERKRTAAAGRPNSCSFLICSVGDVLVKQFSGCSSVRMKKVYGKFCSRHNEAVTLYKELHSKDKRFQAFIKRTMSSSIVRRLSIPECILLVTQRITKYPVLIQRILQHTRESDEDHRHVSEALRCVKELITAVDSKVNEKEKKRRLKEVYSRTDSKSIMRMKSGQMFAKEDLIRGRKLLHDGALQLKNSAGRLKDVHAMLLSDVLVFLQEKDQKYVFASLDQRSTVISLHNLIVREVANEERGLFLITAGIERPEMVEVLVSSKEERNTWRANIQEAMHCIEKDEDEGVPSETEEDKRQQENRTKEIRELLRRKDEQIISLLEEKVQIFRELGNCNPSPEESNSLIRERMLFRATPDGVTKGEPVINDAVREVETLHALVNSAAGGVPVGLTGGGVGPVCLPRRAETFGGFDSHQMSSSKSGEKEEGEESLDLRRTESDSVLKKGTTASLQILLKRNNEQLQRSMTRLHELLLSLQAVVVQQDSFIEDQRQAMNMSTRLSSSSSSLSSSSSSRPSSLIEQEKHRSLERQRQEVASLQKQQAAHQEEKRKREREWELKEKALTEREERLREEEEETRRRRQELMDETRMLQRNKEEYQRDVEWLREAQRRLERDEEALRRDAQRDQPEKLQRYQRTSSTTSEDSLRFHSTGSLDQDSKDAAEQPKGVELSSSAPTKEPFLRIGSKRMGKNFNPFSSASSSKVQGAERETQLPSKLLQLTKSKEKKDKKKKKGKGGKQTQTEDKFSTILDSPNEGDDFC